MAKGRILVCDDEELVRWLLVEHLRRVGYEVVEASNGREALEREGLTPKQLEAGDAAPAAEAVEAEPVEAQAEVVSEGEADQIPEAQLLSEFDKLEGKSAEG